MKRTPLDDWFVAEILPHEAALMRYLRRNGTRRNELQDACQEIYTRIYQRASQRMPEQPKAFAFAIALSMPLLVGHALHPFPDNAGLAASCQMFLQYSMMAVAAGLLAPLLWDSLSHLAMGCAVLTGISMTLLLWQRYATYRAKEAAAT